MDSSDLWTAVICCTLIVAPSLLHCTPGHQEEHIEHIGKGWYVTKVNCMYSQQQRWVSWTLFFFGNRQGWWARQAKKEKTKQIQRMTKNDCCNATCMYLYTHNVIFIKFLSAIIIIRMVIIGYVVRSRVCVWVCMGVCVYVRTSFGFYLKIICIASHYCITVHQVVIIGILSFSLFQCNQCK